MRTGGLGGVSVAVTVSAGLCAQRSAAGCDGCCLRHLITRSTVNRSTTKHAKMGTDLSPRPTPSGRLLPHTLDDEGPPLRYLLAHRQEILERR
jgi:hypothetical protein